MALVDNIIKIVKSDGSLGSTNKALVGSWGTGETNISYGSSSDLWGETWTATDINDVDFGMVISVTNNAATGSDIIADIDSISIVVSYTLNTSASPSVSPSVSPSHAEWTNQTKNSNNWSNEPISLV